MRIEEEAKAHDCRIPAPFVEAFEECIHYRLPGPPRPTLRGIAEEWGARFRGSLVFAAGAWISQ